MNGVIYRITNIVNNKIYIGQTVKTAKERLDKHKKDSRCGSNMVIHRAIRKYGEDMFKTETLVSGITSQKELDDMEKKYIESMKAYRQDVGYNIALGGYSGKMNRILSPDDINEVIKLLKNTDLTFEAIGQKFDVSLSAISNLNTGKTWFNTEITYPIRETTKPTRLSKEDVEKVKAMLKQNKHTLSDISRELRIELSAISCINLGKNHFDPEESYPIMMTNNNRSNVSSTETIEEIIRMLMQGYHYKDISKKVGLSSNSISDIDKGRTWGTLYPGKYPISTYGYMCQELFGLEKHKEIDISLL